MRGIPFTGVIWAMVIGLIGGLFPSVGAARAFAHTYKDQTLTVEMSVYLLVCMAFESGKWRIFRDISRDSGS